MSSLLGMVWTGVSGINAATVGLDVTGNNLANMYNEDYSRQAVSLSTSVTLKTPYGQMGTGVTIKGIERAYDELLAKSVRNESSSYSYYSSLSASLKEAMLYFNELEAGSGLGDTLQEYFDAWQNLSNSATDGSDSPTVKRMTLLEKANTLALKLQEGYYAVEKLKASAKESIDTALADINVKVQNIAALNKQISLAESTNQSANDLRDARDALVDQIAKYTTLNTYERENGQIALMVAGQLIVDGPSAYMLESRDNPETGELEIYWKSGNKNAKPVNITPNLTYGEIGADLKMRNDLLNGYLDQLNELASVLITETNRLHSAGQGLERYSQISGTNGVENPKFTFSTDIGKLPYKVENGTFRISLYWSSLDVTGNTVTNEFNIDIDINSEKDNMYSIIDKINSASSGRLTASLSYDNEITLSAATGYTLAFGEDTSGFLVAAGLNCFFTGTSAADIGISDVISSNPRLVASAKTGAEGDNQNALAMAKLGNMVLKAAGGTTISGFYSVFLAQITTEKSQTDIFAATKKMSSNNLATQLQSVRGVSENDELINMQLYQRYFEANSRYVNVVDEMLNTLINGLGTAGR